MINNVSFAASNYTANKIGFKGNNTPMIDEALKLAKSPLLKDAIRFTLAEKPESKIYGDTLHKLSFNSEQLTNTDLDAMELTLKAYDEWKMKEGFRTPLVVDFMDILEENNRKVDGFIQEVAPGSSEIKIRRK